VARSASACAVVAFATTVLVSACGGTEAATTTITVTTAGTEERPSASRRARSPVAQQYATANRARETVYRGTLAITVRYYGYDCRLRDLDLHLQGTRTYRMPVRVVRGAPATAEGVRESSPYNLIVSASPGNEAGITIVSATVAPDARDGKPILFEYWRMTGGSRLRGTLVNSWRRAGLAANVFPTDRLVVPCRPDLGLIPKTLQTIDEGAKLTATITDSRADVTITGRTFDHERVFVARVAATR
jgi:hypothetical protein